MTRTTTTTTIAALAALFVTTAPARAEMCNQIDPPTLLGQGHTLVIARPDGREMCFTINKSAGLAAGRITVLTVRPVLNASASDIEVLVTKERSALKGSRPHHSADLSAPDLLGGAQVFMNVDEGRHLTVRVRPRHGRDYRLAVIAHEIDVSQTIGAASIETIAHLMIASMVEEMFGKGTKLPFLDDRVQGIVLKSFFGAIKGHSPEEMIVGIPIHLALKELMAGTDMPREARIAVATFVMHGWRELTRNALRPFQWPLPDHERDSSRPIEAALRWSK